MSDVLIQDTPKNKTGMEFNKQAASTTVLKNL